MEDFLCRATSSGGVMLKHGKLQSTPLAPPDKAGGPGTTAGGVIIIWLLSSSSTSKNPPFRVSASSSLENQTFSQT